MTAKYLCSRWAVDLKNFTPSLAQLKAAYNFIQPEERTRLAKFHFIDDFLSSLVGRLLMRKFVSETTNIRYNEIIFDRDVRGKPYLKNSDPDLPKLSFNVSHHGTKVVLAGVVVKVDYDNDDSQQKQVVSAKDDFGVGIDVMKIEYSGGKTLSEFFRVMTKNFSADEWRFINRTQHSDYERLKAFIRHWCLKESFVKNTGVGITVELRNISFGIQTDDLNANKIITDTTLCLDNVPCRGWLFEEQILNDEYCVAIAYRNCKPSNEGTFKFFTFDELLASTTAGGSDSHVETPECEEYCRRILQLERKQIRS